jgi:hypothetical protein
VEADKPWLRHPRNYPRITTWGGIYATRINKPRFPLTLAFNITFNFGIRLFKFKDSFTIAKPQAEPQNVDLKAKADNYKNDLALKGESIASSIILINLNIIKYREENKRTYYAYKVSYNL